MFARPANRTLLKPPTFATEPLALPYDMPSLGRIYLAGTARHRTGTECQSAVAFQLQEPSPTNVVYTFSPHWEVEIVTGGHWICARCPDELLPDTLIAEGVELANRALDLLSVLRPKALLLSPRPRRTHVIVFRNRDESIVRHVDTTSIGIDAQVEIVRYDADGNPTPNAAPPQPPWSPALRFYRLSQASIDIFDAYRSLYLAVEAALDHVCPKGPNEKEKSWLQKALGVVAQRIDLSALLHSSDPVAAFLQTQYAAVRILLFHSKQIGRLIPHDAAAVETVAKAYRALWPIWRSLAIVYLGCPATSGAFTNAGLDDIAGLLGRNVKLLYSAEKAAPSEDDHSIAPTTGEVCVLSDIRCNRGGEPGELFVMGAIRQPLYESVQTVFKIGCEVRNVLHSVSYVPDGLTLADADQFEVELRLIVVDRGALQLPA